MARAACGVPVRGEIRYWTSPRKNQRDVFADTVAVFAGQPFMPTSAA